LAASLSVCAPLEAAEQSAGLPEQEQRAIECGSLQNAVGPWDYRLRESNGRMSWDHNDNIMHHYNPATYRMREGEYSQRVMHDLDFMVRNWPNHLPTLQALMQYEAAGGRTYGYRTVACYFERARRFAPDDVAVMLLEGRYYTKTKKLDRARESYEAAIELMPDSADVNYNSGLFYLEVKEYDKAVKHAVAAYDAGYPLPGLRNRLEKLGKWPKEGAADATTAESNDR
jgi:tetratricopeptide (TPR) repeat protein